ncbi:unnamed protein product [Rotaria sp. Silwood1]|nr:unnamed protein product [Rotaria sp. Silwood1]CAF1167307.1 unnamed protein product [Rotaria sp. Silwood1]CAF3466091.1 unnamed protein product [Rotaria sp. Silwood1]CAF4673723.1 unnamed protein product [Rotaria sp. Silwood1]
MTTHATTPFDIRSPHQTLYSNRIYARTTTTAATATATATARSSIVNRPFRSYLKTFPPINICENLLYDVTIAGDVGSATSSSYINSSEHYDNTFANTYDNPIQYFEKYPSKPIDIVKSSLNDLPHSNENFYDHAKDEHNDENCSTSSTTHSSTSPVLFYLENKNLAICACIISLLLLLLIGLGIFLLNKLIRPVIINTTVNNHYGLMNMSNTTTTTVTTLPTTTATVILSRSMTSKPFALLLRRSSLDILTTTTTTSTLIRNDFDFPCPPYRWGRMCEHMCKPCGLGICHRTTGNCICPEDTYGEFCDLWKVNDKPKRGDMMS